MPRAFQKDPDDVLDYQFDWTPWLGGDTITSYTVTAPAGLTVAESTATGTAVTVWLSGGEVGVSYPITCHVVTADGRERDRTMTIIVRPA